MAFAAAHNVVAEASVEDFWSGSMAYCPLSSAGRAHAAILADRMTPELEERLRELETSVTKLASEPKQRGSVSAKPDEYAARAACIRGWATQAGCEQAMKEPRRGPSPSFIHEGSKFNRDQDRIREEALLARTPSRSDLQDRMRAPEEARLQNDLDGERFERAFRQPK